MSYGIQRNDVKTPHKGEIVLSGYFFPNGSSAPATVKGSWISSVAHTATGVWTITMKEKFRGWVGILGAQLSLQMNALGLSIIQFGAMDMDNGTIIIRAATESGGTLAAADIAAHANNIIFVTLHLKYSNAEDGSGLV